MRPSASLLLVLLTGLGLGSETHALEPGGLGTPAVPPDAIIGGVPTDPDEFDAVIAFRAGGGMCSGTLVTNTLVLTAAHCLDQHNEGSPVTVFFGPDVDGMSMQSTEFGYFSGYDPVGEEERFDYAYIVLPEPYEPVDGVIPPLIVQEEWDETMRVGRVVWLVGYGTTDPANEDPFATGRKREVTAVIDDFTSNGFEFFAGGNDRDTCQGDSGGPALVRLGSGEWRLAGVTSRGPGIACGNGGFYGVSAIMLSWVRDETGIDLLPSQCRFYSDCLELLPPSEEGRCAVGRPSGTGWAFVLLLLGLRRRGTSTRPRAD